MNDEINVIFINFKTGLRVESPKSLFNDTRSRAFDKIKQYINPIHLANEITIKSAIDLYLRIDKAKRNFYFDCASTYRRTSKVNNNKAYYGLIFFKTFNNYPLDLPLTDEAIEDPFSFIDRKYQTTLNILKASKGPIKIKTASDLVAHDQYFEVISDNSTVTIVFKPQSVIRSKGFPSHLRLIKAIEKIKQNRPDISLKFQGLNNLSPNDKKHFTDVVNEIKSIKKYR